GIPDDCRTLVVVPMLLTTPIAIQNQLSRLEIHYLGNTDPNLRFSLLTDFSDAPRQSMPEDAEYIDIVARGIEELNRRHGPGHFFLFHRGRMWSESEQRWIGWERKRGKLELHDHSTKRQRVASERNSNMVLTHLCRSARD